MNRTVNDGRGRWACGLVSMAMVLAAGCASGQRVYFEPDTNVARPPEPGHLAVARIALNDAEGGRIGSVRIASQGVYETQLTPDSGRVPVLQVQMRVVNTSAEPFTFDPSKQLLQGIDGVGQRAPARTFSEGRLAQVTTIGPGASRRFDLIYDLSGTKPKQVQQFTLNWQVDTPSGPHGRAERFSRVAPGSYYYPQRAYAGYWQGYYYPGYDTMPGWGPGLFVGPEQGDEGFYGPEEGFGPEGVAPEGEGGGYAPEGGDEGGYAPEGGEGEGDEGGDEDEGR